MSGRWPASTVEWARFLLLAVRVASVPGMLHTSTVFRVREELPDEPAPGPSAWSSPRARSSATTPCCPDNSPTINRPGLIVLHPPNEIRPTLPEYDEVASGCVLLPGLPHLGLDHRAAWVEADHRGNVTSMISRAGVNPYDDADTAVLAMFLAA